MKKRFLFLLSGINLLLISSITMSLAWFVGSEYSFIEDINITLDVDADLKISTENNLEYGKDSLSGAADLGAIGNFIPVTSMCSETSEWIKDRTNLHPEFIQQYKTEFRESPGKYVAYKGFFQKTVYLYSDKHMLVTLDSEKTYLKANETLNQQKASKKAEEKALNNYRAIADQKIAEQNITDEAEKAQIYENTKNELTGIYFTQCLNDLNKVEDSLRFSILDYKNIAKEDEDDFIKNYTIVDPKKTSDPVVFGGRLSTSVTKDYYDHFIDYDTYEYKEVLFGEYTTLHPLVYKDAVLEDVPSEGTPTCFNAGTRKGVRPLDMDDLATNVMFYQETSISLEEADVSTHPANEQSGYLVELWPGEAHPLTISVYLEGWDRDNVDSSQEASFDVNISFKLYRQGDFK